MNLIKNSIYDSLLEQIREIDTKDLTDDINNNPYTTVVEEQKIYFWIRLYLSDENVNINVGDVINIKYTPSGEELETLFFAYDKQGLMKDHEDQVINYTSEDNKKILCLMIDTNKVNNNNDIPFIRTLFKTGNHYEYQLMRRDDLQFIVKNNNIVLDYFDVDF